MTEVTAVGAMGILSILYIAVFAVYGIIGLVATVDYILQGVGLFKVAKAKTVSHAWLAFLPVGRNWLYASIVDKIDQERGLNRRFRKLVLTLALFLAASCVLIAVLYIGMLVFAVLMGAGSELISREFSNSMEEMFPLIFIPLVLLFYGVVFLTSIFTGVLSACNIVCIYRVFDDMVPNKTIKYFVLSFLLPFAHAICLMKCVPGKKKAKEEDVLLEAEVVTEEFCEAAEAEAQEEDDDDFL